MRIIYGKETKDDGTWRADLYPTEDGRWAVQRFKASHDDWIEMGDEFKYLSREVADLTLRRLGFQRVD